MTQVLALVASELRKRAERANSTFSITDKALVKKLNLDGRERMRVRYYISKIPDAEIWRNSPTKTTFILKSDIALRWCDFLAKRGVDTSLKSGRFSDCERIECRICEKEYANLAAHIVKMHEISLQEYRDKFPNAELYTEAYRARCRQSKIAVSIGIRSVRMGLSKLES